MAKGGFIRYVNYLRFLHAKEQRSWLKKSAALLPFCDIACDILLDFFYHNVKVMDDITAAVEILKHVDESWYDALRDVQDSLHDIGSTFFKTLKRRSDTSKKMEKLVKTLARVAEATLTLATDPQFYETKRCIDACQKFVEKLSIPKRKPMATVVQPKVNDESKALMEALMKASPKPLMNDEPKLMSTDEPKPLSTDEPKPSSNNEKNAQVRKKN